MAEDYSTYHSGLTAPALDANAITPSDSVALTVPARAFYVGGAGNVRVRMVSGAEVTFANVASGAIYPFRITHVLATGTTAAGLIALR